MKAILAGMAVFAVLPMAALAQAVEQPAVVGGSGCFIQVPRLAAPPPGGIAELGEAIKALDTALKPHVDEVNRVRSEVAQLQQRQRTAMQDEDSTVDLVRLDEELRARIAEMEEKQTALRAEYAVRQKELVGPVQEKIGKVAQAFATEQGCATLKMARPADMGGLAEANARDITDGFLAFYAATPR